MNRIAMLLVLAVGLSGCITSRDAATQVVPQTAPVAQTHAAILADSTAAHLRHLARYDPQRLEAAMPELAALAAALSGPVEDLPETAPMPTAASVRPELSADMRSAPSLRHGVHLASYRLEENAVSGWAELRESLPDLQPHRARLERRDLGERGIFLRLKAGPFDSHEAALVFCEALRASERYCMPVDFSGVPLTDSMPGARE